MRRKWTCYLAISALTTSLIVGCAGSQQDYSNLKNDLYSHDASNITVDKDYSIKVTNTVTPTPEPKEKTASEIIDDIKTDTKYMILNTSLSNSRMVITYLIRFPFDDMSNPDTLASVMKNVDVNVKYKKLNNTLVSPTNQLKLSKFDDGLYQYMLIRALFPSDYVSSNIKPVLTINNEDIIIENSINQKINNISIDLAKYGAFNLNHYYYYLYCGLQDIKSLGNTTTYTYYFYKLSEAGDMNNFIDNVKIYLKTTDTNPIEGKVTIDKDAIVFGGFFVSFTVTPEYKEDLNNNILYLYCSTDGVDKIDIYNTLPKPEEE